MAILCRSQGIHIPKKKKQKKRAKLLLKRQSEHTKWITYQYSPHFNQNREGRKFFIQNSTMKPKTFRRWMCVLLFVWIGNILFELWCMRGWRVCLLIDNDNDVYVVNVVSPANDFIFGPRRMCMVFVIDKCVCDYVVVASVYLLLFLALLACVRCAKWDCNII